MRIGLESIFQLPSFLFASLILAATFVSSAALAQSVQDPSKIKKLRDYDRTRNFCHIFRNCEDQPEVATAALFQENLNAPNQPLKGLVDLHTHPMSHLAFGGKLIHGAPSAEGLMPAGTYECNPQDIDLSERTDLSQDERTAIALGHSNSTHGGYGDSSNRCGDFKRNEVINQLAKTLGASHSHAPSTGGYPDFRSWPTWDDITHQHMWVDWVERAHAGGLRVMVALSHHNILLADVLGSSTPRDDQQSGDLQTSQIVKWVESAEFMEVARSPAELRDIVGRDKLAVIIGVELDDIGNFNRTTEDFQPPSEDQVRREIRRLHNLGARYIFPLHLSDNHFGGTALYEDVFAVSNRYQFGRWLNLECSDQVRHVFGLSGDVFDFAAEALQILGFHDGDRPPVPNCLPSEGHVNNRRLTQLGHVAIDEMMRLGMMIDVDHMSLATLEDTLELAEEVQYPVNSGHNGLRRIGSGHENARTADQYRRIASLNGMAGSGWAEQTARGFKESVDGISQAMNGVPVGIGSDMNSLVLSPPPPAGTPIDYTTFPQANIGGRIWNYNTEGVAHYGLMPDFLKNVELSDGAETLAKMFEGSEYFAKMWEASERAASSLPVAGDCPEGVRCYSNIVLDTVCPIKPIAGDSEFGGNGPKMTASARLEVSEDRDKVSIITSFTALEVDKDGLPTNDRSETRGEWQTLIISAPDANSIVEEILSPLSSEVEIISAAAGAQFIGATDKLVFPVPLPPTPIPGFEVVTGNLAPLVVPVAKNPNQIHLVTPSGERAVNQLVSEFALVGDTGGPDISGDADCTDDTRMFVKLNPIRIRWKRRPNLAPGQNATVIDNKEMGPYCQMSERRGDAEFGGNGPEINATAKIEISPDRRQIVAIAAMTAQETNGGDTRGEGTWRKTIYTAPPGQLIDEIYTTSETYVNFVSKAAGFQIIGAIGDQNTPKVDPKQDLVRNFRIVGDTGGDDLSGDNDCGDDTRMSVEFHPIKFKLIDAPQPALNLTERTFTPPSIGPLCKFKTVRGDREFDGNGPRIRASVDISRSNDLRSLVANVTFDAKETNNNSHATGSWRKIIYRAPEGETIREIVSPTNSSVDYVSSGQNLNKIGGSQLVGGLAEYFEIVGDTGGDDISTDENCNDDTKMSVRFNPITIQVRQ